MRGAAVAPIITFSSTSSPGTGGCSGRCAMPSAVMLFGFMPFIAALPVGRMDQPAGVGV